MILDDLLIHGDWLEENDIENSLYKQFLNKLRIKLRKNNQYHSGNGHSYGYGWSNGNGYGFGDGNDGSGRGYGGLANCYSFYSVFGFNVCNGDGVGFGFSCWFDDGDGKSI